MSSRSATLHEAVAKPLILCREHQSCGAGHGCARKMLSHQLVFHMRSVATGILELLAGR